MYKRFWLGRMAPWGLEKAKHWFASVQQAKNYQDNVLPSAVPGLSQCLWGGWSPVAVSPADGRCGERSVKGTASSELEVMWEMRRGCFFLLYGQQHDLCTVHW